MYKLCKTEQSADRQRELERGLLDAMATQRFDEISISDLCDSLQVPRKSFYRYFSGKEGALHALIDHTLMDFADFTTEFHAGHIRSVQRDLECFFRFWLVRRRFLDALVHGGMSGVLIDRCIAFALSEEIMPVRFLPQDSREMQRQIITFSVCGLMSMVLTWQGSGYARDPGELAAIAVRMLSQPLFPNADQFV